MNSIYLRTALGLPALILLLACTPKYSIHVNAITDIEASPAGTAYTLSSEQSSNAAGDLYFQEFSRYFHWLLKQAGYRQVTDQQQPDLNIRFAYNLSDPETGVASYSWPIWETFGGETIVITETSTSGGVITTTRRKVHIPVRTIRTGTAYETRSYTLYTASVHLAAYAKGAAPDSKPLWQLSAYTITDSSDLRSLMPYLAAASASFLGKNSGQEQRLVIRADDPLVKQLQALVPKPATAAPEN